METAPGLRAAVTGLPRFLLLLTRLVRDPRVSGADKAVLAAAIAYALNPFDLIPDFIPLLGQLDDLLFVALAIDRLVENAGPDLIKAHWNGPEEELVALSASVDGLARRLPGPVRRQLRRTVQSS